MDDVFATIQARLSFYSCCLSMASDMRGHCSLINLNSRRLILIFNNKYNNNKQLIQH